MVPWKEGVKSPTSVESINSEVLVKPVSKLIVVETVVVEKSVMFPNSVVVATVLMISPIVIFSSPLEADGIVAVVLTDSVESVDVVTVSTGRLSPPVVVDPFASADSVVVVSVSSSGTEVVLGG